MTTDLTPSQTVGPFLHIGLIRSLVTSEVVPRDDPRAMVVRGRLLDGAGTGVPDGMVETWQAEGLGRSATGPDGSFEIVTTKPGRDATAAPHLAVLVFARGLLKHLHTRIYFPDEPEANATDPVLTRLSAEERATLVAQPEAGGLRFDIVLQGPSQTTFFAV
jgi:protocatechuate 3,4-dioxygenase, alpha subunit